MKWYAALSMGLCLGLLGFGIARVSDKNDMEIDRLQNEIAELKQDQEQLKKNQEETRKAAAVYETVAREMINREW